DSRFVNESVRCRTVRISSSSSSASVGVATLWSFEGDCSGVCCFVGEVVGVVGRPMVGVDVGVVGRIVEAVEEGEGDSGRRKGEVRGEPKERGEGLYVEGIACEHGEYGEVGERMAVAFGD
ncbi:MAG: hypothetical protein L6R42_011457, partial [Xanthoria sp. 1 TBL-2021]